MGNNKVNRMEEKIINFKVLIDEYCIYIPIIQRDYVQGNDESVLGPFLDKILEIFITDKKTDKLHLDFIYGYVIKKSDDESGNECFIPIDGQQRLTTLFLVYWYLCKMANQNCFNKNQNLKLDYEVRTTSREFCNALIKEQIQISPQDEKISDKIKNSTWYFTAWDNDPTIKAMLNALDMIHKKFKSIQVDKKDKLLNKFENIIFSFLDLKNEENKNAPSIIQSANEIFIKMNARGLPLTPYENLKAEIIDEISDKKLQSSESLHDKAKDESDARYFARKMDNDWSNGLFEFIKENKNKNENKNKEKKLEIEKFDEHLMNLIRVLFSFFAKDVNSDNEKISKEDKKISKESIIVNLFDKKFEVKPYYLKKWNLLNADNICFLMDAFQILFAVNKLTNYIEDNFKFYFDENNIIIKTLLLTSTYTEKVQFYAYIKFLIEYKKANNNNTDNFEENLKQWMRVIHNLTKNTDINNSNYIKIINSVNSLIVKIKENNFDIIQFLSGLENNFDIIQFLSGLDENNSFGFDKIQFYEEIEKAKLFKDEQWKDAIINSETKNEYFKGQIGFLLYFCKNNNDHTYNLNNFKKYSEISHCIFDKIRKDGAYHYEFEQAVLAQGYYFMEKYDYTFHLLTMEDPEYSPPHSWKNFLQVDFSISEPIQGKDKIKNVKNVFNEIKNEIKKSECSSDSVKNKLEEIRDNFLRNYNYSYKNDNESKNPWLDLWRVILIHYLKNEHYGYGYVYWYQNKNYSHLNLLNKVKSNSSQVEPLSACIAKKISDNNNNEKIEVHYQLTKIKFEFTKPIILKEVELNLYFRYSIFDENQVDFLPETEKNNALKPHLQFILIYNEEIKDKIKDVKKHEINGITFYHKPEWHCFYHIVPFPECKGKDLVGEVCKKFKDIYEKIKSQ